jgi:hypothetical protein
MEASPTIPAGNTFDYFYMMDGDKGTVGLWYFATKYDGCFYFQQSV